MRVKGSALFAGLVVYILLASLLGCASTELIPDRALHEFKTAPLVGMVYQSDNRPCEGVLIELLRNYNDNGYVKVKSDVEGRFVLNEVRRGKHRIRLSKMGYQTMVLDIDFSVPTDIFYAQILSLSDLLEKAEEKIDRSQWQEAYQIISEAMVVDSLSGETLFLRAVVLAGQGRDDEAALVLERMRDLGFSLPSDGGRDE